MTILTNNKSFKGGINSDIMTATIEITSGTAQLQARGENPDGTVFWVDVPDGLFSAKTNFTINASAGQFYRFTLTGDARVSVH